MPKRPRKSSCHVALVLVGAATLVGCDEQTLRRDIYASRDDCVTDWGDQLKCEQSVGPRGHYWSGPAYRPTDFGWHPGNDFGSGARPGSHAIAGGQVSRGGFGAHGAAHGFGGG